MLTLAIDQKEIRKANEKMLWRVDCISFSENDKDLVRERQVLKTTRMKKPRRSLMNQSPARF